MVHRTSSSVYVNYGMDSDPDMYNTSSHHRQRSMSPTDGRQKRPIYEQEKLNQKMQYIPTNHTLGDKLTEGLEGFSLKRYLLNMFPILAVLKNYSLKEDLIHDVISGSTVGIMHIPQGMGYALIASLPAITGIYMAIYPVILYILFGTSKHNSMGTFAVISILVSKVVLQHSSLKASLYAAPANGTLNDTLEMLGVEIPTRSPIEVGSALGFLCGAFQIVFFFGRMGVLSAFLSDSLISGFTTGASMYIFTSQVKEVLGVTIKPILGNFELPITYYQILLSADKINWTACWIACLGIFILSVNADYFKPRLAKKCVVPIPMDLIWVVCGTLASGYFDIKKNYGVKIIGHIQTGFPPYEVPDFNFMSTVWSEALVIAIVSYTVSVSMATIFANKDGYEIDGNQELLAMGTGNVFGSFFSCYPVSASLSRSAVQYNTGGRSQLLSVVSIGILSVVLIWIGPFFELLPKCVLSSVIITALRHMLMQVTEFPKFLRMSYLDGIVWLATFLTVILVSIDMGLWVGMAISLGCIFLKSVRPYTCLMGNVPKTDIYLDIERYKNAIEIPGIKIYHYAGCLNFSGRQNFKNSLLSLLGINLGKEVRRMKKALDTYDGEKYAGPGFKLLIFDFSALSYIDSSGVYSLKVLTKEFTRIGVPIYMAGSSYKIFEMLKKCDMHSSDEMNFRLFPTIHDAVHYAQESLFPSRISDSRL